MLKSLWARFFILLVAVSAVALSSALLLRELMIADFREYIQGETEDRVYWVTASLESSYERYHGWEMQRIIEEVVWALMLGFDVRLYDSGGKLITDTESAVNILSPLVRKRVLAISRPLMGERSGEFIPYSLFLGGQEIGRIDMRNLRPRRGSVFIGRSNRLLAISVIVLGGLSTVLSIVFSRRLTRPIGVLTEAVSAVAEGDLRRRVKPAGSDELSRLAGAFNTMAQSLEIQESLRRRLTANIAHELRTPLSAVRGELEGMMDGLLPADKENIQSLYEEIGRLKDLIEGIEELAQAEASGLSLKKETFEVCPYLSNMLSRYRKSFQDKGVDLDLECTPGLEFHADPARLSQILINLLSNALKATGAGGHVTVSAERRDSEATLTVADTGAGIRPGDLPFVFERFFRTGQGGLGLGLTIVRELAEAHGGSVSVESEYGKGTTFVVSLPA